MLSARVRMSAGGDKEEGIMENSKPVGLVPRQPRDNATVDLFQMKAGLGERKQWDPRRFKFGIDSRLEPCFTDGDQEFNPEGLAESILDSVFSFFAD
jgi:hypothetical protein